MTSLPSVTDLARWSLAAQHAATRSWSDDEDRLSRFAEDHEIDLQLATDLDLAVKRATLAPGHDADELLNRWVSILPDLSALLSIRFEGGEATKPFVDASALSRPVAESDLDALRAAAVDAFGSFGARYLRIWSAAGPDAFTGTHRDKRFLAAPLRELREAGPTSVPSELSLAPTRDLTHWDDAAAAYAAVDADHPEHTAQAALQDKDDLKESIDAGTLFDVLVDDAWAGWVAGTTDTSSSLGLSCYEVQELILAPGYRGRGYGQHLITLLARELPEPDRVLIGTIHADNRGAIQSALRAGRHDVGGWFQLPLPSA
ncbi:GNAT family N-acetyltransferase [Arthrobacter echini]|uniref:GNAT family N-acetyltransferase n=1 Tax=Arthrobacter echini TaxID=1529066 RepID=A0A4S5E0S0_9MICC|nr:GNAT family N-acetyltransferase [Arthrobacter echini]THJ64925.1 GNAT family N-acetyltransferase [Arthrobacter echini]